MEQTLLEHLLVQSPKQIDAWMEQVRSKQVQATSESNWWLSLVKSLVWRARYDYNLNNTERIDWAEVSINLYNYIVEFIDPASREALELSQMALRVAMINEFGPSAHAILDPFLIEQWFFERLDLSIAKASKMVDNLSSYTFEEKTPLYAAIDRTMIIDFLIEKNYAKESEMLQQWIQLRDRFKAAKFSSGHVNE